MTQFLTQRKGSTRETFFYHEQGRIEDIDYLNKYSNNLIKYYCIFFVIKLKVSLFVI